MNYMNAPCPSSVPFIDGPWFILWKYVANRRNPNGKPDKLPIDANGIALDHINPQNWKTFRELVVIALANGWGIGLMLGPHNGYFCIDLDHAIAPLPATTITQLAADVLAHFPGCYVERTVGGKGLHVIGKLAATPPAHRKRLTLEGEALELYTNRRFVTVAPGGVGNPEMLCDGQLAAFITRHGLLEAPAAVPPTSPQDAPGPRSDYTGPADDRELLELLSRVAGSAEVVFDGKVGVWDLFTGNAAAIARSMPQVGRDDGCPFDRTRAEAALMYHLFYFTGGDRARMERLFRASALHRPEQHEGKGYYRLREMLDHAMSHGTKVYDRPRRVAQPAANGHGAPMFTQPAGGGIVFPRPPRNFYEGLNAMDLLSLELPDVNYLVDGLIAPGVHLLIGKPKKGKSWLTLDLALAVSQGSSWLERQCAQGEVLYFALEDNRRRAKLRLQMLVNRVMNGPQAGPIIIRTMEDKIEPVDHGFMADFENTLRLNPRIRLVIIDTLAKIKPSKKVGESIYDYDRRCIDPFTEICARYPDLVIIIVHHMRKAETDDPYDTVNGSLGLTGAGDGIFVLMHDRVNDCDVLHATGREIETQEMAIKLNAPKWELLGDPDDVGMRDSHRTVLEVFDQNDNMPMTMTQIVAATGAKKPTVQGWLYQMKKKGMLIQNGYDWIKAG
jgi:hypothetical protein